MDTLEALHGDLKHPDKILTMLFCRHFLPFFELWVASCQRHGIEFRHRLIVFTLDRETEARMAELGILSCHLDPDVYLPAGNSNVFGDQAFRDTVLYKNRIILDLLNLGCDVLFQDVDIIWKKDPLEP